ncbi:hypothetical protein AGLY_014118 [Aphis glycines]|uniref:Uncharacterized protein n=1 Tax=Aphis glycines TaxID=307491 RepID=A0A6G0T455_APHGL|nr:hypothetical protein AGLY_014118 [Aphis glycines]
MSSLPVVELRQFISRGENLRRLNVAIQIHMRSCLVAQSPIGGDSGDKNDIELAELAEFLWLKPNSFAHFYNFRTSGNISLFSPENIMEDYEAEEVLPDTGITAENADTSNLFEKNDAPLNEPSPTSIKNTNSPSLFQQQLLKVLDKSQNKNEDGDHDKHFLLSLLPGMKAIDNAIESVSPYCLPLQPIQYSSSIPELNTTNEYTLQAPDNVIPRLTYMSIFLCFNIMLDIRGGIRSADTPCIANPTGNAAEYAAYETRRKMPYIAPAQIGTDSLLRR